MNNWIDIWLLFCYIEEKCKSDERLVYYFVIKIVKVEILNYLYIKLGKYNLWWGFNKGLVGCGIEK